MSADVERLVRVELAPRDRAQPEQFRAPDTCAWMEAGRRFQGGTLRGIASKLDYLRGLGVTTLWIGPVWRQRPCPLLAGSGPPQ